jgi:flagella basal body P-ring formation protein FlgA
MIIDSLRKISTGVAEVVGLRFSPEFLRIQRHILVAAIVACGTHVNAATQITLRANVEMTKNLVRLGDVADIVCDDAAEARDLASLPLMPAPAAGSRRFVRPREIEDTLAAQGIDLESLTIGGAAQVHIESARPATPGRENASGGAAVGRFDRRAALSAGSVEASAVKSLDSESAAVLHEGICTLISSYLKTRSAEAGSCTITCDVAPRHLAMLASATSRPECGGGSPPWTGRQRFEISFATGRGSEKFFVHANVTPAATPVVVALRPMARGEVVTAADVELQMVDNAPRTNDRRIVARSVDALIGMEVRQPIPAGGMVFMDAVQSPILVKRGELIRISTQSGGIRVRTTARALQDRAHGQLVEVESLETKERFDARVVGPGEAAIVAIATPTASERSGPITTARRR